MLIVSCRIYLKKKILKCEIDLLNFIVVDVIFKQCWYLSTVTKKLAAIFWSWYNWTQSKNFIHISVALAITEQVLPLTGLVLAPYFASVEHFLKCF